MSMITFYRGDFMTDQPPVANPMNAAAIPMNRTTAAASAATPMNSGNSGKPTNITGKTILSVDLGRTSTKTCVSRETANVAFIPANVKQTSIEQIRGGVFEAKATDPLMDLWLEYQGSGYAVGQLAADFGANLGVGQSKVEDALVKVL
jgi:plasmid segregation protein ParM